MKTTQRISPIIFTALLAISGTWVSAEPAPHDESALKHGPALPPDAAAPAPGPFSSLPPHLMGLKLSEAQEDKIFNILHAEAPAIRNNFRQQYKLNEEIEKLSNAPSFDEKRAKQISSELARIQADAIFARASTEARIRALLTPEQISKLEEKREQARGGRLEARPFPASKPWDGRPKEELPKPM